MVDGKTTRSVVAGGVLVKHLSLLYSLSVDFDTDRRCDFNQAVVIIKLLTLTKPTALNIENKGSNAINFWKEQCKNSIVSYKVFNFSSYCIRSII
ncbi:hypothetical protein T4D_3008 [Trichinella pseudospiralis]|uniref:Uncharacterized protein n=1 Tax=Trichinella pseudospiralis TaxID=6337 RepID=A0A0V1FQY6_TRIPS|nr:hypothetical protein T4D_3008 [Trichinella pseudospiralis]